MLKNRIFYERVQHLLIHDFSDNSLREVKSDNADSMKIASWALAFWQELREYSVEDETWQFHKIQNQLYVRTLSAGVALHNGMIALIDQTSPETNHHLTPFPTSQMVMLSGQIM